MEFRFGLGLFNVIWGTLLVSQMPSGVTHTLPFALGLLGTIQLILGCALLAAVFSEAFGGRRR